MNQRQILWAIGISMAVVWASNNIAFVGNVVGPRNGG